MGRPQTTTVKAAASERSSFLAKATSNWRSGLRGEILLLLLLLLAVAIFVAGYGTGVSDETFRTNWYSSLQGTKAAPLAVGSIQGGQVDEDGNTPLLVTVRGLEILGKNEHYVLYVIRSTRPPQACGSFTVGPGATQVHLSYPGLRVEPRGWLIARERPGEQGPGTILLRATRAPRPKS